MRAKITKSRVDQTRSFERDVFVWDTELRGFGLKVTKTGRKVYLMQYRLGGRGNPTRRCTIGVHGSPWTPDAARTEAKRLAGLIAAGEDPAEAKSLAKQAITVSALCNLYLEEGCGQKKASTIAVERGLITRHIKPLLGARRVNTLKKVDITKFMVDVANGKTADDVKTKKQGRARVTGGKGTANRTVALLASMLTFAVDRQLRDDNPAHGVKRYESKRLDRFLSPRELAQLGEALTQSIEDGENPIPISVIRLLVLTGCRKSEILSLRWAYVDFENQTLRLPDSKTGAKIVPLGAPALELLSGLHAGTNAQNTSEFVFPSAQTKGHFVGLTKVWYRVRARAGLNDVRLHDLRHSFASVGVSGGDSLYIVGKLLGHRKAATTERYSHVSDDPVRSAADRIAITIAAAMDGEDEAEVVPMKGPRGA